MSKEGSKAFGAEGRRFESFRPDQQASRNISNGNTWEPGHESGRALRIEVDVPRCPRKSNVSPARIQVWGLNVCSRVWDKTGSSNPNLFRLFRTTNPSAVVRPYSIQDPRSPANLGVICWQLVWKDLPTILKPKSILSDMEGNVLQDRHS